MTDPHDPLAGRDPYPREQIDLLGLHRERAELLEEIVSTSGPGAPASPTRTKVLVSLGVAAALAVVGGGAWFATSGESDGGDDPVAAASATPDESEQTPGDDPSGPEQSSPSTTGPGRDDDVRSNGVRIGDVLSPKECRRVTTGVPRVGPSGRTTLRALRRGQDLPSALLYVMGKTGGFLVVDEECRVVQVRRSRDGELRLRVRPAPSDQR